MSAAYDIESVLLEARFFLKAVDIDRRQLVFLQTNRDVLAGAAFIDGRSQLAVNTREIRVPLTKALHWYETQQPNFTCDRLIAHTAFCGSTLLARALECKNYSFVYKEPQALIDLVRIKQHRHDANLAPDDWSALVKICLHQFQKSWSGDEVSVVKPSNWVNILLPELLQFSADFRLVLLSSSAREFLLATLRGGRDRFAYVLNFLNQLQLEFPAYAATIAAVESEPGSGLIKPLKHCAIAFHLQQRLFDAIGSNTSGVMRMSMQELLAEPGGSVSQVAQHLDITLPKQHVDSVRHSVFKSHSKDPEKQFGANQAAAVNSEIENLYAVELDQVMHWYNSTLMGVSQTA
jgi:hypothetical protein